MPSTGKCLIESARGFGQIPDFDGVSGYDPETKSWKSLFFNKKGECVTRHCYAPELKGNEASFRVRFSFAGPDGKVTKENATWQIKISPRRYEIKSTDAVKDGEEQPDIYVVFERK
jgi:hypothetical protein